MRNSEVTHGLFLKSVKSEKWRGCLLCPPGARQYCEGGAGQWNLQADGKFFEVALIMSSHFAPLVSRKVLALSRGPPDTCWLELKSASWRHNRILWMLHGGAHPRHFSAADSEKGSEEWDWWEGRSHGKHAASQRGDQGQERKWVPGTSLSQSTSQPPSLSSTSQFGIAREDER